MILNQCQIDALRSYCGNNNPAGGSPDSQPFTISNDDSGTNDPSRGNRNTMNLTDTQQMIYSAFNSQVYVSDRMDVQSTPLYDTVTLAANSTISTLTTAFFTNVGAASNKTLAQTNMTQSQKLPAPEAFSVFGFRLRWAENILLADLYTILTNFALSFYLGQKRYQLGPLWYYNAGGGINAVTTATTTTVLTNGVPTRESMHKLAIPVVIENQMTFYAQFEGTQQTLTAAAAGGTGATFQLLLDGLYARGVQ